MIRILLLFVVCYLVYAVISTWLTIRRINKPTDYCDIA